jgi:uncharacterized protein (DUF427 family)
VVYFPAADVDANVLRVSTTESYCPYKGDAGYIDVVLPDGVAGEPGAGPPVTTSDAGWFYADSYQPLAAIARHIAFYPDRVRVAAGESGPDLDWTDLSTRSPDAQHD